jgi:hypothetical protein
LPLTDVVVTEEGSVGGCGEDVYGEDEIGLVEGAAVKETFDDGREGFGCVIDCV